MTFHPVAWLAWAIATMMVVLSATNPVVSIAVIAALIAVAHACGAPGPERRTAWFAVRIALVLVVVRTVLFGLTGHEGATTIVTTPSFELPGWLGGFAVGGRITGEVVSYQIAEGLRVAAVLITIGVLFSVIDAYRVLAMVPRVLFEAGLVIGIAVAFVPVMVRRATEVREAQRMRGYRARGVRGVRAVVVPVLADALERSLDLAASMESRGFGRGRVAAADRARQMLFGGVLTVTAGAALVLLQRPVAGAALVVLGGVPLASGLMAVRRTATRTRLRRERVERWDHVMVAGAALTIAAATVSRAALPTAHWYPYPVLRAPSVDPLLVLLGAAVAFPLAVVVARASRIERASRRADVCVAPPEVRVIEGAVR